MQIVILAAGLGSRLGKGLPKALVNVAGKTMIEYQMEWAENLNPDRIIVISGFHHDDMKAFCKRKFPSVIVVENKRYKEQNLYSLLSAGDFLDKDTLIMNVDHIYLKSLAKTVALKVKDLLTYAIFADTNRTLTNDDMKVFVNSESKKVERISKKLSNWSAGYIGMTFIKKDFWSTYLEASTAVAKNKKEKAVVEMVIQELIDRNWSPELINSDGNEWYEIDTMDELVFAEASLLNR